VPVTINYHFVLEAPSLIKEHLSQTGQERFYEERDEFSTSYKISKFLVKFFTRGSDISVSVGKPMDVLGHYVNEDGHSLDKNERIINTRDYFISKGEVNVDPQREEEYTQRLGRRIVDEFHRNNRVFSSHLVAFTAFQMIKKLHPKMDLFNLLRLAEDEIQIPYEDFKTECQKVLNQVEFLKNKGKVNMAPHLNQGLEDIINHGLSNVGLYHAKRPLIKNQEGNIITQDLNLLYFYHNRLDGYDLEKLF